MAHTLQNQKKLLTRVRRIQGQLGALETALLSTAECSQVLQQIAAIRGATNGLMMEVLEGHIREHLANDAIPTKERQKDVEQVLSVLHSYVK